MGSLVEQAMKVLRELPEKQQKTAAHAIIDFGSRDEDLQLSDEQVAEIEQRIKRSNRKFLSLAQVRKRLRHFGV